MDYNEILLTSWAKIIDKNNLFEYFFRWSIDNTDNGTQ